MVGAFAEGTGTLREETGLGISAAAGGWARIGGRLDLPFLFLLWNEFLSLWCRDLLGNYKLPTFFTLEGILSSPDYDSPVIS